jgi:hypothetical protein
MYCHVQIFFFFFTLENLQFFVINKLDSGPDSMIIYPEKHKFLNLIFIELFLPVQRCYDSLCKAPCHGPCR